MTVTRFTFFTENFVICCYQVTKIVGSGHDCTSTSSARSPRYFCIQADIAIWVLRKVRVDTMLTPEPGSTFARGPIGNSWEELEVSWSLGAGFLRGSAGHCSSTNFSLKSCSQSGKSCNRSLCTSSRPSFLFLFSVSVGSCNGFPRSSSLVLPLLPGTGFSVYPLTSNTESCDEDDDEVDVGVVEELEDKPGTTNGT